MSLRPPDEFTAAIRADGIQFVAAIPAESALETADVSLISRQELRGAFLALGFHFQRHA
jgi:hypothetical protein